MRNYVIRRVLLMIPTIFIVTIIVFFLIRLIPGNIVDSMIGQVLQRGSTEVVDRAAIEHALGLDVPVLTQYARWIGVVPQMDGSFSGILQGDLGVSLWRDTTVLEEIAFRWPVTLELGVMGLIISQLIALPIGVFSALRQDKWGDYIGRSFAILCISIPGFWLGTLIIVFPAIWGGMTMRMTRTMMLEVLRQDYIRTAWAKGLRERIIVMRHTLKNALIPVITVIGWQVPVLVGGTVIIEQIFCLPGMGRLFLDATLHRDYPVVSGVTLVFGLGMVLINLVVDITYGFLDPRVHYR